MTWDIEKQVMEKIQRIAHDLDHAHFLTKAQKETLKKELWKLQKQLDEARKVLYEENKED